MADGKDQQKLAPEKARIRPERPSPGSRSAENSKIFRADPGSDSGTGGGGHVVYALPWAMIYQVPKP